MRRNRTASSALAGFAALLALLLLAATASAAPTFTFDSEFTCSEASPCVGAEGASETSLKVPALATDEATGDVYAIDRENQVVDRFSATGEFLGQLKGSQTETGAFDFGTEYAIPNIAVDNSGGTRQGTVYVVSENQNLIFAFDAQGEFLWQESTALEYPCGVAVNSEGDLWVSNWSTGIEERNPEDGSPVSEPPTPIANSGSICDIEFDSADNLLAKLYASSTTLRFPAPDYSTREELITSGNASIYLDAVDTSNDLLFVPEGPNPQGNNGIYVYDSDGKHVETFGVDLPVAGLDVNASLGKIYTRYPDSGVIEIYSRNGGAAPKPSVRTGVAGSATASSALINGQVNPNGATTACEVEYVDDGTFQATGFAGASTAPCTASAGSGSDEVDVSASLSGLSGDTTYHYRLLATSANGTTTGSSREFDTAPPMQALDVTVAGSGTVQCDAGTGPEACQDEYEEGVEVIATATAAAHNHFVAWTGCDSVSGSGSSECHVTIGSSASSIKAEFAPTMHALTVAAAGSGSVTCNGGACAGSYQDGTEVTLIATPAAGFSFAGWGGGGCTGTGNCKVLLGADTAVTATFNKTPVVTPPTTQPPVVNPPDNSAAYGQCVAKANKAFAKAKKAAKHKHGNAKAKAMKKAKAKKAKAVAACKSRFK